LLPNDVLDVFIGGTGWNLGRLRGGFADGIRILTGDTE
jgi:hypothetical protein